MPGTEDRGPTRSAVEIPHGVEVAITSPAAQALGAGLHRSLQFMLLRALGSGYSSHPTLQRGDLVRAGSR